MRSENSRNFFRSLEKNNFSLMPWAHTKFARAEAEDWDMTRGEEAQVAAGFLAMFRAMCCPWQGPSTSARSLIAHWRAPRPWRSPRESRLIRRLVWRWYKRKGPHCSGRELARHLGVSHTCVQKLLREFWANTDRMVKDTELHSYAT